MPRTIGDGRGASPPPGYSESTHSGPKATEASWNPNSGPWLVRRTSIHIESTSADAESMSRSSMSPSRSTDQRSARVRLFKREDPRESIRAIKSSSNEPFASSQMGTQVTIEATQPVRNQTEKRIELKGLEQAASAKRWTGSGHSAEAWGKLAKVSTLPLHRKRGLAHKVRTPNSGIRPVTHTYSMVINDQVLLSASNRRC